MQQKRQDRRDKGKNLNMTEHPTFARHRADLRAAALTGGSLQNEVLGNKRGELSPSQLAQIDTQAFELFKKDHPDLIQECRANDLYFTPPDKDGNQQLDYRRDPWMRTVDAQAHADPENAAQIYAQFCAECPDKAKIYALLGHKELALQVASMEAQGPDSSAAVAGQAKTPEAAAVTVNFAEQQLKTDLAKYAELSARTPGSMTFAEKNEMRQLQKDHQPQIAEAQRLADEFDKDPNRILSPAELDNLEKYKAFLKTPDTSAGTQQGVATATPTTPDALKAQNEKQKRTLGNEAIGKLKDRNIDITMMNEAQVLHALKDGAIKDPNGDTWVDNPDTQAYIRGAFAEQQMQQAEATLATIPQATIDKLVADNGLKKEDILGILLALLASGAISSIPKLP
jgi:hypothetical protein